MRVLFVTPYYWPESVGAGVWAHDLMRFLAQRGHQVCVLTTFPHYPEETISNPNRSTHVVSERHDGVQIVRVPMYHAARGGAMWKRVLSGVSFGRNVQRAYRRRPFHADVVLALTPPISAGSAGLRIARLQNIPCVLYVADVVSEAVQGAGLARSSMQSRMLRWWEASLFRQCDAVTVLGETFRRVLVDLGVEDSRIAVVPTWTNAEWVKPMAKENRFRQDHGLIEKFVVMYTGNIGYSCDFDTALQAAACFRDDPLVRFVFVGAGVRKQHAIQQARELSLQNVIFLPLQAYDAYPECLAAADVCLVTLRTQNSLASIPSKLYSAMAAGRPVLAVVGSQNDAFRLVRDERIGFSREPGDVAGLVADIRHLRENQGLTAALGRRSRAVQLRCYSLEACGPQYERLLTRLADSAGNRLANAKAS